MTGILRVRNLLPVAGEGPARGYPGGEKVMYYNAVHPGG